MALSKWTWKNIVFLILAMPGLCVLLFYASLLYLFDYVDDFRKVK